MSEYVKNKDLHPQDCKSIGPLSDGGWNYFCFRPKGHEGACEAMASEGESIMKTEAGTVRWYP